MQGENQGVKSYGGPNWEVKRGPSHAHTILFVQRDTNLITKCKQNQSPLTCQVIALWRR